MLLPSLLLCMALLIQPACLLYTTAVMQAAAAEGCRVLATRPCTTGSSEQAYEAFVLRRLAAVPDAGIFHQGGSGGWSIEMEGSTASHTARVSIETSAKPLPLLGVLPALLGMADGSGGVRLRVEVEIPTRAAWVEGDYRDWASTW